ncbi:MAG: NADH-quinone oxidoreductase subunit NuoE [Gammaproteobacteria bacterium]
MKALKRIELKIDQWLAKFPPNQKRSGLIYALHLLQEENGGWLKQEDLDWLADYLELPKIAVYEVASFYTMYDLKPVGKYKVQVCMSVSCMLNGCDRLADHLKKKLKINWNETSQDGLFTLKRVECLAACGGAPAFQINKDYHENMTEEKIDQILAELAKKDGAS